MCVFFFITPSLSPTLCPHSERHHLQCVAADERQTLRRLKLKRFESELTFCLWMTRIVLTKTTAAVAPKCPHDYAQGLNWHEDYYKVCLFPNCPTVYSDSFVFKVLPRVSVCKYIQYWIIFLFSQVSSQVLSSFSLVRCKNVLIKSFSVKASLNILLITLSDEIDTR